MWCISVSHSERQVLIGATLCTDSCCHCVADCVQNNSLQTIGGVCFSCLVVSLNVSPQLISFRGPIMSSYQLVIHNSEVERVRSTKFLAIHPTDELTSRENNAAVVKKAQQHLDVLCR